MKDEIVNDRTGPFPIGPEIHSLARSIDSLVELAASAECQSRAS